MACVWRQFVFSSALPRALAQKLPSPSPSSSLFSSLSSSPSFFSSSLSSSHFIHSNFSSKSLSPSSSLLLPAASSPLIDFSRRNIAHNFFWSEITPTPNETNTVSKEEKEAAEEERKTFDYEPWYDPRRGFPIVRSAVRDNTMHVRDIERLQPRLYIPADTDSRLRLAEFQRLPEDIIKYKYILKLGRHVKVIKDGRVSSFSALVIIGNGNGVGGFGYGKGEKQAIAINFALRDAEKNLVSIQRYEDRTITEQLAVSHFNATKVIMRQLCEGSGTRACTVVTEILRCFGIHDVSCKIIGRTNMGCVVRAIMKILLRQRHPIYIARATGKKYYDRNQIWRSKMYSHSF